ncbi:serine hydrolase domain-containing protein [Acetobacterium bakii]|uniref:serine hydrolase domain-containing protein n=1 Tax=Acetobacterium bakii TaxID=52689 RepID=UPI0006831405|nr:serine hydrolase domain-containing protein [Acetobacterium bakii]
MKKWKRMLGFIMTVVLMGSVLFPISASAAAIEEGGISVPSGIEYSELEGEITEFINQRKSGMASVSLAVFDKDETLYAVNEGYADIDLAVKADENTVYEWGSVSKLLVWVSVMQLEEQGLIDLNADIRNYLPDGFLTKLTYDTPITMTHLMNHTAGFQETTYDIEVTDLSKLVGLEKALEQSEPAQIYEPGTVCAYSNWGASLAAYMVETVSGEDFCDYVHGHIFEPLGLKHTSLAPDCSDNGWVKEQRQRLNCYSIYDNQYQDLGKSFAYILLYPSGAATGTLGDFQTFAKAFVSGDGQCPFFKEKDTIKRMLKATSFYGGSELKRNAHGLWTLQYGVDIMGHSGNTAGCTASLFFDPVCGVGVVVMTNELGETAFNYGLLSLIFGAYENKEAVIKNSPDQSGIYTSMRTFNKGFTRVYKYMGSLLPLSKTEDSTVFKPAIGQGTLTQVTDQMYWMDNENGWEYLMYRTEGDDGSIRFEMMSQDIEKENSIAFGRKIMLLFLMLFSWLAAGVFLIVLLSRWIIFKTQKRSGLGAWNKRLNVIKIVMLSAILIEGVLIYYLVLLPLDGGSVTLNATAWKCVLLGILSILPIANLGIMIKKGKNFKGTAKERRNSVIIEAMGLLMSINIWYWQFYNFWSC